MIATPLHPSARMAQLKAHTILSYAQMIESFQLLSAQSRQVQAQLSMICLPPPVPLATLSGV